MAEFLSSDAESAPTPRRRAAIEQSRDSRLCRRMSHGAVIT